MDSLNEQMNTHTEVDFAEAQEGILVLLSQREELLLRCKKELLEFLEISDFYDASGILQKLNDTRFLEERAVVFPAIINHRLSCPSWASI